MICPKCKKIQDGGHECDSCGIIFQKFHKTVTHKLEEARELLNNNDYGGSLIIIDKIMHFDLTDFTDIKQKVNEIEKEINTIIQSQEEVIISSEESNINTATNSNDFKNATSTLKDIECLKDIVTNATPDDTSQKLEYENCEFNAEDNFKKIPKSKVVIKNVSFGTIAILLFVSFYLHWQSNQKIARVADVLMQSTGVSISKVAEQNGNSLVLISQKVDSNSERIFQLESYSRKIAEAVDKLSENSHYHTTYSDKRLKEDYHIITNALDKINLLNTYIFKYKKNDILKHDDGNYHFGYFADDVEKIFPEIVHSNDKGYKKVDYIELVPLITVAMGEQSKRIENLEIELANLTKSLEKTTKSQ